MSGYSDQFADLCTQTIVWERMIGRDKFGDPSYADPQTFPHGRRNSKITRVSGFSRAVKGEGADVISESQILILAVVPIGYEDRVYVQGDEEPFPPVVSVGGSPDESGVDQYTKVYLGSANG